MEHLSVDIETFSSVDIRKAGLYKYVQSPDFQVLLFAYAVDYGPVQIVDLLQDKEIPAIIVDALFNPRVIKHAYNASFEWYCLSKHFNITDIYTWLTHWQCTMVHGLYCGYPAGLAAISEAIGLPVDKRKMGAGSSLIKTFCTSTKPSKANGMRTRTLPHHEPEKWRLFKEYCIRDVEAEMEIDKKLINFPLPSKEYYLWLLDQKINGRGVEIDHKFLDGALFCSDKITQELMSEAVQLSGLENPKSVKQLTKWLEDETGEEVENLQKATVSNLIETVDSEKAKRMLEIRQELSKTSVKKYSAMKEVVCDDGRARGLVQFYGANRTGRWAGRLIQVQNLPRNYISTLSLARKMVKGWKLDQLKLIYGNVPDTLSQLIRTAFVPAYGHTFIVADFSAIEARVLAWLAGEHWRLDVFNSHGKIYEASASQMFGVPIEKIHKGNPEYELRQKGKVAELALGYQGGAGALVSMGALDMGLTEAELPEIVALWRNSNKRIQALWYSLDRAALEVMKTGRSVNVRGLVFAREIDFQNGQDFFTITLPSSRKLYYVKPFLTTNQFGKEALHYYGMNQTSKKWEIISTYGGKIVENCLAGDSLVLTYRGWVPIAEIASNDLLWDGEEWVRHSGLVVKGHQDTISVDGVRFTPDHLILTERGWVSASSCEGYNRYGVELPDSHTICRFGRKKITLENSLCLQQRICDSGNRIFKRKVKILRMSALRSSFKIKDYSRDVKTSSLLGMEVNERPMYFTYSSSLGKLWWSRYQSLQKVVRKFSKLLGRYGFNLQKRVIYRQDRCEWRLYPGKLQVGIEQNPRQEQEKQHRYKYPLGVVNRSRSFGNIRYRGDYITIPDKKQLSGKPFVLSSGRYEQVYDIVNAGPRHRFTVLGKSGPFIVHNCVQAIARDCLAINLKRLDQAGYGIVMHIHDEVVLEVVNGGEKDVLEKVCSIMGQPINWAPGLPLAADGFITDFYMKD